MPLTTYCLFKGQWYSWGVDIIVSKACNSAVMLVSGPGDSAAFPGTGTRGGGGGGMCVAQTYQAEGGCGTLRGH